MHTTSRGPVFTMEELAFNTINTSSSQCEQTIKFIAYWHEKSRYPLHVLSSHDLLTCLIMLNIMMVW